MEPMNFTDEQIEEYLLGYLDQKDKALFEKALESDEALSLRLKEQQKFILGIEKHIDDVFLDELKVLHQKNFASEAAPIVEMTTPQDTARRRWLPILAAAATIALLIFAGIKFGSFSATSESLFADNFRAYELNLSGRDEADQMMVQVEELYEAKKYQEALPLFETLIKENENSSMLYLGSGITKLSLDQTEAALADFDRILQSDDLLFKDHAIWYTALTYLKMDDQVQAKAFLQQLADRSSADHHREAIDLLKKL